MLIEGYHNQRDREEKERAVGVIYSIMFQIAALSLNRPEQIVCKITQGTLLWVKHLTQTTQHLPQSQCEFVVGKPGKYVF